MVYSKGCYLESICANSCLFEVVHFSEDSMCSFHKILCSLTKNSKIWSITLNKCKFKISLVMSLLTLMMIFAKDDLVDTKKVLLPTTPTLPGFSVYQCQKEAIIALLFYDYSTYFSNFIEIFLLLEIT